MSIKIEKYTEQMKCKNSCINENGCCDYVKKAKKLFVCTERKPHLVCPYIIKDIFKAKVF